jgi:hypothetical protein
VYYVFDVMVLSGQDVMREAPRQIGVPDEPVIEAAIASEVRHLDGRVLAEREAPKATLGRRPWRSFVRSRPLSASVFDAARARRHMALRHAFGEPRAAR